MLTCPLKNPELWSTDRTPECEGDQCARWISEEGACAVRVIAKESGSEK